MIIVQKGLLGITRLLEIFLLPIYNIIVKHFLVGPTSYIFQFLLIQKYLYRNYIQTHFTYSKKVRHSGRFQFLLILDLWGIAIRVMEFSSGGYKIRKMFA